MASIRQLKKDIDYLVFEVISDCFTFGALHPDDKEEEVTSIISDAVALRNDLIHRVNNPESGSDLKVTKVHYKNVVKDLYVGVDDLCGRLSALPPKEK
jgi:hypothetical protein